MEVSYYHCYDIAKYPELIKLLDENLFSYKITHHLISFDISEKSPLFSTIKKITINENPFPSRSFTKQELDSSKYLTLQCFRRIDYPMPDGDFNYRKLVFDQSSYCEKCGVKTNQIGSFKVRENKFKKIHNAFKLNWEEDRYFVSREIYNLIFKKYDVPYFDVLNYKTNQSIPNIVQLNINNFSEVKLENHYKEFTCPTCLRKKYLLPDIHNLHKFENDFDSKFDIFKLQEYFGHNDHRAIETIIVTNRLYQEIKKYAVKGFIFEPINI